MRVRPRRNAAKLCRWPSIALRLRNYWPSLAAYLAHCRVNRGGGDGIATFFDISREVRLAGANGAGRKRKDDSRGIAGNEEREREREREGTGGGEGEERERDIGRKADEGKEGRKEGRRESRARRERNGEGSLSGATSPPRRTVCDGAEEPAEETTRTVRILSWPMPGRYVCKSG